MPTRAELAARDAVVVVGAGAAGLVAAIFAAGGTRPVVLLERTREGGRKILISGGGRCNILPSSPDPHRYVTDSSRRVFRRIFDSWPLDAQRRFFERRLGLPLALEEETGKLFPQSNSARAVRDALVRRAVEAGVAFRPGAHVLDATRVDGDRWMLHLAGGASVAASRVILATGGLSVPATGSDGGGLELARRLGHRVNPTYPALTPLVSDPPVHASLAGVSLPVALSSSGPAGTLVTRGGFLFTHQGYSGPSVLDISHVAVRSRAAGAPQAIHVQWAAKPAEQWDQLLREARGTAGGVLRGELPARLAEALLAEAGLDPGQKLAELRRDARRQLAAILGRYLLPWTGDEGYRKAEVTGGGVDLGEVRPPTLESRRCPGLSLCGELLDVFGPIGGYNFVWAWVTGRLAGLGAALP